ncbi:hypothetical protein ASA1KI_25290 [Opitutales bacterium ASA1]|nr:hypothetical protein ASA1KI_25290 [Opitutales bacterium ASA1]
MNILVLRGGALGDFVVTLPALAALRGRWPSARIVCVGNARAATLARSAGLIDEAHDQNERRWSRLGADDPAALHVEPAFADLLRGFDLVVNFWPDPDCAIARDFAALGFMAMGPRRFVSAPSIPKTEPAARHFLASVADVIGTDPSTTGDVSVFRLRLAEVDRAPAVRRLPAHPAGWIAWHPGSGSPAKNWPVARWLEVLARLRTHGELGDRRLAVILGTAEAGRPEFAALARDLPTGTLVLRDDPPVMLAAVLERCSLFLGHDTGPAHVAAAVGCPCALVFGPTDPAVWAPPGAHVRVVRRGERTDAVTIDDVLTAVTDALEAIERDGVHTKRQGFADQSGPA